MSKGKHLLAVSWRISSRSASGGSANCVEAGPVRDETGRVAVRHSHQPDSDILLYTRAEWSSFVETIRQGSFDLH
jgi:hypothetical protein